MLGFAVILALSVDVVDRASELWSQSCASPDGTGLCAKLDPAQFSATVLTRNFSGVNLECRVANSRAFATTRHRRPRDSRAKQSIALLARAVSTQLGAQDPGRWARARILQGDDLYEQTLEIATTQRPLLLVSILPFPPAEDPRRQRALEQASDEANRRNGTANRLIARRLKQLYDKVNQARAIYEDVRKHGPPAEVVVALMRLGQLGVDFEQAIGSFSTLLDCRTDWTIWNSVGGEAWHSPFAARAKQELLFCMEAGKRQMLVNQIEACESELQRINPAEYSSPNEIVREPRP